MNGRSIRGAAISALPLLVACTGTAPVPTGDATPSPCADAHVAAPAHPFPPEALAARRAALLEELGTGVLRIPAARDPQDLTRMASDFYYFTGLDDVSGALVLIAREDGRDEVRLYVEPLGTAEGVPAREVTAVDDVRCVGQAGSELAALGTIRTLEGWRDLSHRLVKDADEQERLRRVADISVGGLVDGMRAVRPGALESEVRNAVERAYADSGAARLAFESIVAGGRNALVLHYTDAADELRAGDVVILDVGAEHARYAGDVSRTVPVSGRFTQRQREVYDVLVEARQAVLDVFAGGGGPSAAQAAFRRVYAAHRDTCGGPCERFMPHLLFHPVGLDVHDPFPIPSANVAGTVLNVEPGLYFARDGFGMRIEDTILLTGDGYELLTDGLPTTAEEIEAFMAAHAND